MIGYLRLAAKAFLQVALVAMQTRQIAGGRTGAAFVVGFLISAVWWFNARSAGRSELSGGWAVYALGAACGTVTGMWAGGIVW